MAWMNALYQTYEANSRMAGKAADGVPLSLVAHMTATAQIEILLEHGGDFCGAHEVEKKNGKILIPVTEASASRSSGIAPHALCDMLPYVAGDFGRYLADTKAAKTADRKFEAYLAALKHWAGSPLSHPKVRTVYAYASQKRMTRDLIGAGVLEAADSRLLAKKVGGTVYEKALVRFRILDDSPDAVWLDESLFDAYMQYYLSLQPGKQDLCYLTGKTGPISLNHPKGIVAANYGAKLISANDTSNFTFRGRFLSAEQACAVGYGASQKAHGALTWLAARQGVTVGMQDKRTYICWNPNGKRVADLEDPLGLENDDVPMAYTEAAYKKRLIKTLAGFRGELDNNDDIVVIGLDAATTGRLSITYYNELKASDFYDRLTGWGNTCCWYFTRFSPDKKPIVTVSTPLTKQLVLCAFGTEHGNFLEAGDALLKEQSQRILHCILDGQPLPRDIMHAAVRRASTPLAYSRGNREKILSTACALIAKYHTDRGEGGTIAMALDRENTDRSYLFGRLLAVLERAEYAAFSPGESRETNAIRLQNAYVNHPMSTWKILTEKLNPYLQQLTPGLRNYYRNLISEITEKLSASRLETLNRPLDELYLIGYYLQRADSNRKETKEKNLMEEQE